jgi:hypothetical protein
MMARRLERQETIAITACDSSAEGRHSKSLHQLFGVVTNAV